MLNLKLCILKNIIKIVYPTLELINYEYEKKKLWIGVLTPV